MILSSEITHVTAVVTAGRHSFSDGTSETTSPVIDAGASAAAKANDEGGESMHEPLLTVL